MDASSVAIRYNPFKPSKGTEGSKVPWSPYGRILSDKPVFTLDPLFHAGCYYVQDSSAMYVGHIFRKHLTKPGLKVLDLCAAPGGKTTDLAASLRIAFEDDFFLVSNEVMKARLGALRDNVAKWGDPNVLVTSLDPSVFANLAGFFDIIVADVPCSGEGMFRKDPRAVQVWSPELVKLCAARQRRILADVWPALKQGGILIYSTCTYESEENDDNLEWAAKELGGEIFTPEDEFADYGVRLTPYGHLLKAGEVPGEGQWVGALRKTSPQVEKHSQNLSILKNQPKQELDFDPDYPLSLNFIDNKAPKVEVDKETALKYLHKDVLILKDAPKGLITISYQGHPLGYAKNIGIRCNNLLPKSRRILMDLR